MNTTPKVSIITVSFNSERTIEKTIQSVSKQSYVNKEFIIIDGLSQDNTMKIIDCYPNAVDLVISEEDGGIPEALNKGIKLATGDWLYFLSSDDLFFNDTVLEDVFDGRLDIADKDLVYGNVVLKSKNTVYDGEFNLKKLLKKNICHQAQFFKRTFFEREKPYNEKLKYLSDYELTIRMFTNPNIRVKYIPHNIAVFNDQGRTSYLFDEEFYKMRKEIFLKNFKPFLNKKEVVVGYYQFLYLFFKQGDLKRGSEVLMDILLISHNPKVIKVALDNYLIYLKKKKVNA